MAATSPVGQVRVEGVAPGRVVVRVPAHDQPRRVAEPVAAQPAIAWLLARFSSTVPQVSTVGTGRGRRPRARPATNPVTAAKPLNSASCGSSSGVKKLPDWRNNASNVPRVGVLRVQHRQRAEAHADTDPDGGRRRQRRDDLARTAARRTSGFAE